MGLLSGVRIVDATYGSAGPLLGQLLADLGADLIRIDLPQVDVRKDAGSMVRLRGRRSLLVDLAQLASRPIFERLVGTADVLVAEAPLDGRNRVPLAYDALCALNPRLVYCRVTAYGDDGPLADAPAHDHLVAARYGVYDQPGWRAGPTYLAPPVPSLGAAFLALQAIGNALYVRERTGLGQEVTTSLLAGSLAFRPGMVNADSPPAERRRPPYKPFGSLPFYSIYECGDGAYLHFGCLSVQFQKNAIAALALAAELADYPFNEHLSAAERDRYTAIIAARMKERPYAEWAAIFEAADVPHGEARWTEDLLDDPQVRQQGLVVSIDDRERGAVEEMGELVRYAEAPFDTPAPAPRPGEHTDAVLSELGYPAPEIAALHRAGVVA
jgi:crotonobetainyl-CoA:carnitine CoA-transferase CaiB-like acyl-CoA transferase